MINSLITFLARAVSASIMFVAGMFFEEKDHRNTITYGLIALLIPDLAKVISTFIKTKDDN